MMRSLAPVRVRRVETDVWDAPDLSWLAICRVCSDYLAADTHAEALAWAHGHMHVRHPGWHPRRLVIQPPTHAQLAAIKSFDIGRVWVIPNG